MNKKYLLFLAVPVLAVALGTSAYAFYGNQGEGRTDVISAIAKKFNLNASDVQKVFDEQRTANQTQNEQKFTDFINKSVTDGKITRNSDIRLVRNGIVVFEGKIASLKRFKEDVKEVIKGFECGIGLENFNDLKINDTIETFRLNKIDQYL